MRRRTGYLYKRNEVYQLEYVLNGKRIKQSLKTGSLREAEALRAEIMKPMEVAEEIGTLAAIQTRIDSRQAELATLDEKDNPPLPLAGAWAAFDLSPKRPDAGEGTLTMYRSIFRQLFNVPPKVELDNAASHRREGYKPQDRTGWINTHYPEAVLVRDVSPKMAREYAEHLGRIVTPNTYNKHRNFLRMMWGTLAEQSKGNGLNPWEGMEPKKLKSQTRRELTVSELRQLCNTARGELRTLFALGLFTGLRRGDCCTLRWSEVDMVRGSINRIPSKTAASGRHVFIPIHAELAAILAETPASARKGYVLPGMAAAYPNPGTRNRITDQIRAHFKACEIATIRDLTGKAGNRMVAAIDCGFHSLRHSFVSICRGANVPSSVVEAIVGHSNPAMTRHYTHTSEPAAIAAVKLLPSILELPASTGAPAALRPEDELVTLAGMVAAGTATAANKKRLRLLAAKV